MEEIFHSLSEETFPAEAALERIGKKALPEVLRVIEADSTPAIARENALSVWMVALSDMCSPPPQSPTALARSSRATGTTR